jgi:hypothetical protein
MKYVKLIAKPDTWYKAGTEVFYDDSSIKEPNVLIKRITKEDFAERSGKQHSGCMVGIHTPNHYHEVAVVDEELCFLEEFEVIETDEYLEFQDSKELKNWYEQDQSR